MGPTYRSGSVDDAHTLERVGALQLSQRQWQTRLTNSALNGRLPASQPHRRSVRPSDVCTQTNHNCDNRKIQCKQQKQAATATLPAQVMAKRRK
ncbi:hypothetical protein ABVT39_013479 [Epinephelus coioides]